MSLPSRRLGTRLNHRPSRPSERDRLELKFKAGRGLFHVKARQKQVEDLMA